MTELRDIQASLDFLRRWGAPWVLVAIAVDQKQITTATFHVEEAAAKWLRTHENQNLYFHVNPVLRDLDKKAERTDIAALAWLHVDIDPRAGEDIAQEQARAHEMLRRPPGGLPLPTVTIFSGGGYQGFWKLREPVPINGSLEAAEDAKRYNLQLELLFGADQCHNVDRIMRLPGTVNWPNAKKRKKGRVPAQACLVEWAEDRVYDISAFTKAPVVQAPEVGGFQAARAPGNIRRLGSIEELPGDVPEHIKILIVQGKDPDDPTKYPSRSEPLFAVCCALARANVDDETIYSIITDKDFAISESVLEKGSNTERYALKQIRAAHDAVTAPELRELNERYAVIRNFGGKCRVIEEVFDPATQRPRLTKMTFEDFANGHCNRKKDMGEDAKGRPMSMPLGKWWLQNAQRRQYNHIVFAPRQDVEDNYNLWQGFGCDACPGDCSLLLDHIRENVCAADPILYEYLINWMARAVQFPDTPGFSAIVMRGRRGVGKSFLAKTFGALWGRHFLHVADSKHLVGNFNAHLRDCVFLFGDEAFYAGDRRHESVLKMLITEETLAIEAKGIDVEQSPNYVHLMLASNEDWVVPAGFDERRFLVLNVSDAHAQDTEYFGRIQAQIRNGGLKAFLHFLLTRNLLGFDVRTVPKTQALQEQKEYSMSSEAEWWRAKLDDGRLLPHHDGWQRECITYDLLHDYLQHLRCFGKAVRSSRARLANFLKRACPEELQTIRKRTPVEATMMDGNRVIVAFPYFWVFPALDACRQHWDATFGGPYTWPEIREVKSGEAPF